jgi:hypothetical protein
LIITITFRTFEIIVIWLCVFVLVQEANTGDDLDETPLAEKSPTAKEAAAARRKQREAESEKRVIDRHLKSGKTDDKVALPPPFFGASVRFVRCGEGWGGVSSH